MEPLSGIPALPDLPDVPRRWTQLEFGGIP